MTTKRTLRLHHILGMVAVGPAIYGAYVYLPPVWVTATLSSAVASAIVVGIWLVDDDNHIDLSVPNPFRSWKAEDPSGGIKDPRGGLSDAD